MTRPPDAQGPPPKKSRTRLPLKGGGRGMPPVMWVAIVVVAAGAFFLFRQGGNDVPTGIGERRTVITSEAAYEAPDEDAPRSGDVDIADQGQALVPEKPEGDAPPAQQEAAKEPAAATTTPTQTPTEAKPQAAPPRPQPKPDPIVPLERGPYMVQLGSFGSAENADKEAARIKQAAGYDALVKVGNTSDGKIIYRVRIGYFKSRSEAEKFIRENRKTMGGAIAVHR
jgi:DedD protein